MFLAVMDNCLVKDKDEDMYEDKDRDKKPEKDKENNTINRDHYHLPAMSKASACTSLRPIIKQAKVIMINHLCRLALSFCLTN